MKLLLTIEDASDGFVTISLQTDQELTRELQENPTPALALANDVSTFVGMLTRNMIHRIPPKGGKEVH